MKVLLLDVNCKYSSTGKLVYDLYTQLKGDGHVAAIAYGRGPKVDEENIYRFAPQWEVYLHALLTRITGYTGCFSPIATHRLKKFIEEFQPDVVHLHDMHGYFVNIIPLIIFLKQKNIKTIWTFHCEFMYTGKCGHAYECEKWKEQCDDCPHLRDYPQSLLFDKTTKMFKQKRNVFEDFNNLLIISPSDWLASRIKQSFLKERRVVTIHNGIDTNIFYRRDARNLKIMHGIGNEKIVLAVAPNLLSENKGGESVLAVAHNMRAENVKFVLVGITQGEREYEKNIIPVGLIRDQELLAQYYSMADVFVICSKRENYPTTCVEARACGLPIVGFDVGGVAETAEESRGFFVRYGDLEGIQKGIEYFLNKKLEEESAGSKAVYARETMYQKHLEIYTR